MNDFRKKVVKSEGFSLLETVVAVALLIGAVIGPVGLISRSLRSASFSGNDLIARNLAQEGIELFRAVRDNNVLCVAVGGVRGWDRMPGGGGRMLGYYEISVPDPFQPSPDPFHTIAMGCGATIIRTPLPLSRVAATCVTPLTLDAGVYTYGSGAQTNFSRCVRVCSPATASPCSASGDGDIPANDQMEIISTVSWMEHGVQKNVTLRDRLYNWK